MRLENWGGEPMQCSDLRAGRLAVRWLRLHPPHLTVARGGRGLQAWALVRPADGGGGSSGGETALRAC